MASKSVQTIRHFHRLQCLNFPRSLSRTKKLTSVPQLNVKDSESRPLENIVNVDQSLTTTGPESRLPEPFFPEQRKENFLTNIPQRIMQMEFEQDIVEKDLESARTAFELCSLIKFHLPVMDHVNFMDGLLAFHRIVAHHPKELEKLDLLNISEFVVVMKGLVKFCRDFSPKEAFDITCKLLELGVPLGSLPITVYLELMKFHMNRLSLDQLVRFFKVLSVSSLRVKDDKTERKFTAMLMGVETLITLRFEEEFSVLDYEKVIELLTFLRPEELTPKMYKQSLEFLISQCHELSILSVMQLCRWYEALDYSTVVHREEFQDLHRILFAVLDKIARDPESTIVPLSEAEMGLCVSQVMRAALALLDVSFCLDLTASSHHLPEDSFSHSSLELTSLINILNTSSVS